jgi:hypothetical protein
VPVLAVMLLLPAHRFSVDGKKSVHTKITEQALSFLRPAVLEAIDQSNREEDKGASYDFPERHFTNCLFRESVTYVNARYRASVLNLARARTGAAAQAFGLLLHGVQDFYSHSAWVDPAPIGLGYSAPNARLIEHGIGSWTLPEPYHPDRDGIVMIQGNPPSGVTVDLPRDRASGRPISAVPVVTMGGTQYRGLMTSTAGPITFATAHCPPVGSDCWSVESVCIRHAEPRKEPEGADEVERCVKGNPEIFENCFHHDDPRRPRHAEAVAAAIRQTAHEWCRLLHLANHTDPSGRATSHVLTLWVRGRMTPHPPETPCAPKEQGTFAVAVQVAVLGGQADYYAIALHTTDLRRSAREQFESGQLLQRPLELCVSPSDTVLVSVWGWKDDEDFGPESAVAGDLMRVLPEPGELEIEGRNGLKILLGTARASSC